MAMAITKTAIINGKKYTVEHVFNMVSNWHFTDKDGNVYLVDGEDLAEWFDENRNEGEVDSVYQGNYEES